MTALVFVTQKIDERDPVLGFVPRLVTALAERVGAVTVIANEVATPLPAFSSNVSVASLGKERGAGKVARGLRYERLLARAARRGRADALLAHMCPEYLDLAIPVARAFGFPTLLWFVHPALSRTLRLANATADAILTALPGSYPLPSSKVHVIGHATDMRTLIPCPTVGRSGPLRVVAIGRTSPVKGFDLVVRAIAACVDGGLDIEARIVGPSVTAAEERHLMELIALVHKLGLDERVQIQPSVLPSEVRGLMCEGDVVVNATVGGSGDKVIFEAAALYRPVLASNPSFSELLGGLALDLTFPEGDVSTLAERLRSIAIAQPGTIGDVSETLRDRVERGHSLDHWADAVIDVAAGLAAERRRRR